MDSQPPPPASPTPPDAPPPPITHYAGFDWAKDHHDIIVVDAQGIIVADFRIEHTPEGWQQWVQKTAAFGRLAVAIETSSGAAVEQLLQSPVTVFPVNPLKARRYRERKSSSGNKTDRQDAWALADALRLEWHNWRALSPQDPIITELRILCRDEVALIEERTALINQLRQALHEYYPAALKAFDDWTVRSSWAFVLAFPTAAALKKAGKRKWEKFLHVHRLYRPQTYDERMQAFQNADQWKSNPAIVAAKSLYAVSKASQLQALQTQLDSYRRRIQELFASHPDSDLFGSLPGAGEKLAPRLLSEIGSDRALYADASDLQCEAGTAPVNRQSGIMKKAKMRRACNKHLRAAMHLQADLSRVKSSWAATYYDALREKGKSHAQALRCLGQRWLKIIWKMWQAGTSYNADLHLRNQLAHGSWVLAVNPR